MFRTILIQCSSWSHRICFTVISQSSFCTSRESQCREWLGGFSVELTWYSSTSHAQHSLALLFFFCVWLSFFVIDCQCPFQLIVTCGSRKSNHAASGQLTVKCTVLHINHVGKELHQSDIDYRLVIKPLILNKSANPYYPFRCLLGQGCLPLTFLDLKKICS